MTNKTTHYIIDKELSGGNTTVEREHVTSPLNGGEDFFITGPTDVVRIDGKRYRLADRRAEVGEKILVVEYEGFSVKATKGDVLIIENVDDEYVVAKGNATFFHSNSYNDKYYVLEPIEENMPQTLIANLASEVARLTRKVAELEEQVDSNRKDIVKQAEEFADMKARIAEVLRSGQNFK